MSNVELEDFRTFAFELTMKVLAQCNIFKILATLVHSGKLTYSSIVGHLFVSRIFNAMELEYNISKLVSSYVITNHSSTPYKVVILPALL